MVKQKKDALDAFFDQAEKDGKLGVNERGPRASYFTAPERGNAKYTVALHAVELAEDQQEGTPLGPRLRFTVLNCDLDHVKAGTEVVRSLTKLLIPAAGSVANKAGKSSQMQELGKWAHALAYSELMAIAVEDGKEFDAEGAKAQAAARIREIARLLVDDQDGALGRLHGLVLRVDAYHAKAGQGAEKYTPGEYKYVKGTPLVNVAPQFPELGDFKLLETVEIPELQEAE